MKIATTIITITLLVCADRSFADDSWREAVQCGPNSLYMFLRAHGHSLSLQQVRQKVPVTDKKGCSFRSLELAARELGAKSATIIQTTLQGLEHVQLPVVIHADNTRGYTSLPEIEPGSEQSYALGHFSLLVDLVRDDSGTITAARVIDPTLATTSNVKINEFLRYWSGYALVPSVPRNGNFLLYAIIIIVVVVGLLIWNPTKLAFARSDFAQNS